VWTLKVSDDSQIFVGQAGNSISNPNFPANVWSWSGNFSKISSEGSIDATINSLMIEQTDEASHRAEFDATMTIDGTIFDISTITPLEAQDGDSFYNIGQFQISAGEDFIILIDADGGDPDSALITITSEGSTTSQSRAWSDEFYVGCLGASSPPAVDCL